MIKLVIFDFDGTLANSIDMVMGIYNRMAPDFGTDQVSREEFPYLRKLGYKKAMKEKGIHWSQLPRIAIAISKELKSHMKEVQPYDGIVEELTAIKKSGYDIGILTSNQEPLVRDFLNDFNFPEFTFLVSEKSIFGKDKALKKIIKKQNLDKDTVVYVGDEPRDVIACRKTGIAVIGVSWGLAGVEGFAKAEPDRLIDQPKNLLKTIKSF